MPNTREQRIEDKGQRTARSGLKTFTAAVVVMVAAVIGVGLYLAGSPTKERDRRFDEQRANELQQIANAVDSAYYRDGHLPGSLAELAANKQDYVPSLVDPKTGAPYEYGVTGDITYDLCATFDDVSQQTDQYGRMVPAAPVPTKPMGVMPYPGYRDWTHPAGHYCYHLTVENRLPNQACSLTNPCQTGQTCAQLPGNKGTYCVPAGKECLAAGCPEGKCVVMESYPAQVRCTTETVPPPPPAKADCILMQEKKSGKVDCFGCGTKVCKDPASGWEPYSRPSSDSAGIPYACYDDDNGACALAQ